MVFYGILFLPNKDVFVGGVRDVFTIENAIVTDWRFVLFCFCPQPARKVETRL